MSEQTTTIGTTGFKHTFNGVELAINRTSTAEREGKSSVAYWGIDLEQFAVNKKDGDKVVLDEAATLGKLVAVFGFDRLVSEWMQPKLNANLKATQLDAGKDKLTMEEKQKAIIAYIDADFGRTSKGGGGLAAAFNSMKAVNVRQAEINKRMFEIGKSLVDTSVSPEDKVKLLTEMTALSVEVANLGSKK